MDRRLLKAIIHPIAQDGRYHAGEHADPSTFHFAFHPALQLSLAIAGGLLTFGCDSGPRRPPLEAKAIRLDPGSRLESQPISLAFADLDGDGLSDIVTGERSGPIHGYRYPGWERFTVSVDNAGEGLAAADMDGDGWQDLISNAHRVAWYRNPGLPGPFEEHVVLEGPSRDLAVADLDGDGDMDVAVRRDGFPHLQLLFQDKDHRWTAISPGAARQGMGSAVADLDGDGRPDLIGCGEYLTRRKEDGSAGGWRREQAAPWGADCLSAAMDVDRDGRIDLVLSSSSRQHRLSWLRNPGPRSAGDATPWVERVIAPDLDPIRRLRIADLDGNGTQDIVFAEAPRSRRHRLGVMVDMEGKGGYWSMRLLDDGGAVDLAIGDVGLDGRLEVLAAGHRRGSGLSLLTDLLVDAGRISITPRTLTWGRPRPLPSPTHALAGSPP